MIDEEMYLLMIFGDNVTLKPLQGGGWLIEKHPDTEWDIMREYSPKGYYVKIYRPPHWSSDDSYIASFVRDPEPE